jgi:hypothetical protein
MPYSLKPAMLHFKLGVWREEKGLERSGNKHVRFIITIKTLTSPTDAKPT